TTTDSDNIDDILRDKEYISNIQKIYRKILGENKSSSISSVHYISMTNTYFFEHFFNGILYEIYKSEGKLK
ncbi:hypothetical protein ACWIUA_12485, partial [Ursidibacter sp. B-7004-1]